MIPAQGQVSFRVSLPESLSGGVAGARVLVYLIADKSEHPPGTMPAYGPFVNDPQPVYATTITDEVAPGGEVVITAPDAEFFHVPLGALARGGYSAQAVIDRHHLDSRWWCEPGNLHSGVVRFSVTPGEPAEVRIACDRLVAEPPFPQRYGAEEFVIASEAMTYDDGSPMKFRVGVSKPVRFDEAREYSAIYEFPEFGMDHRAVFLAHAAREASAEGTPAGDLARRAFWFTLSPIGPNGCHYFLDSPINGDLRQALIFEILGAIEERYPLKRDARHRFVTGTGAGAWTAWQIALTEPDTFGGCWAVAPVHFDLTSVYGVDLTRGHEGLDAQVRTEIAAERLISPNGRSGGRWDSLRCSWSPFGGAADPIDFFGAAPGLPEIADHNLSALVRQSPGELVLRMRERVRIIMPDDSPRDTRAMRDLVASMNEISFFHFPEGGHGYVKLIDGARESGAFLGAAALIPKEMNEALDRADASKEKR